MGKPQVTISAYEQLKKKNSFSVWNAIKPHNIQNLYSKTTTKNNAAM